MYDLAKSLHFSIVLNNMFCLLVYLTAFSVRRLAPRTIIRYVWDGLDGLFAFLKHSDLEP